MSLTVSVWLRDNSGARVRDTTFGDSRAAGFENWRTQVWGSPLVRALGAEYFPQLDGADLYIDAGQLAPFIHECALICEHLEAIAAAVDLSRQEGIAVNTGTGSVTAVSESRKVFREHVSLRLANIEAAARRALDIGGEVIIW